MFPRWTAALAVLAVLLPIHPATADGPAAVANPPPAPVPVLPVKNLRVFMNTVNVIEITDDIHTVIVANPDIADASVLSPRKLYLLGKQPGQTSLLVTDANGNPLLRASILVAKAERGVVTVDRGIHESTLLCAPRCMVMEDVKPPDTSASAQTQAHPPSVPQPAGAAPTPAGSTPDALSGIPPQVKAPTLNLNP